MLESAIFSGAEMSECFEWLQIRHEQQIFVEFEGDSPHLNLIVKGLIVTRFNQSIQLLCGFLAMFHIFIQANPG